MAPTVNSINLQNTNPTSTTKPVDISSRLAGNGSLSNAEITTGNTDFLTVELNKLSKKYNISVEELKKIANNGLKQIAKRQKINFVTLDNSDNNTKIRVLKFLNDKLADYVQEKKINTDANRIDINNFTKFLEDKHRQKQLESAKDGLAVFLINNKLLKLPEGKDLKTVTLDDIPPEELESAVTAFIQNAIEGIKNCKDDKNKIKTQLEHLKTLLHGVDDRYVDKFWDAAKKVMSENKMLQQGITEIVKHIGTSDVMNNFITKISSENLEALGLSKDELATAMRNVGNDPDALPKLLDALFNLTENSVQVERTVKDFREKNNIPEEQALTEEQVQECFKDKPELLKIYQSLCNIKQNLKAAHSGAIVGATENNYDISDHLARLKELEQTYNVNITQDLYDDVNKYIQEHKDDLKISVEEFDKQFNLSKTTAEEKVNNTNNFEVKENDNSSTGGLTSEEIQARTASLKETLLGMSIRDDNQITVEPSGKIEETIQPSSTSEVSATTVIKKLSTGAYEFLNVQEINYAVKSGLATMGEIMYGVAKKVSRATQETTHKFADYVLGLSDKVRQANYASASIGATTLLAKKLDEPVLEKIQTNSYTKDLIDKQVKDKKPLEV